MAIMVSDLKRRPFRRQCKAAVHRGITVFDIITLEHAPVYKFCVVSLKLKPSRPAFFPLKTTKRTSISLLRFPEELQVSL
jgi:hypothetical protein